MEKLLSPKEIDFYFFSGTGNTLLVVREMVEVFKSQGYSVNLLPFEKSNPEDLNHKRIIGLGFPVAQQGTYKFIWDFITSLPNVNSTKIFMIDTMGAYSGGIVGPMKKILSMKGYIPIGSQEIKMPNNLLVKSLDENENKRIITEGLNVSRNYAWDLIKGTSKWDSESFKADLMSLFSKKGFMWALTRKAIGFKVDYEKCVKCSTCAKSCPVNNIKMTEYPEYKNKCQLCQKCMAVCSLGAISPRFLGSKKSKYISYKSVNSKDLVNR